MDKQSPVIVDTALKLDAEAMPEEQKFRILKLIIRKRSAQIGGSVAFLLLICAIFGKFLTPYDPFELDTINRLQPPSWQHIMGTDEQGRDVFSRIIFGSRYTVQIMLLTSTIATLGGTLLGMLAAYFGKWVDLLIMQLVDIMLSFPYILLVLAIVAIIGPNLMNAMVAIGIAGIAGFARLTRSTILTVREENFVQAERALGASDIRIMTHTIFPNILAQLVVFLTLRMPISVLSAASLSFIGLGAQPPLPEWGAMLVNSRTFITTSSWVVWAPGMSIFIVVLGINLLGNAIRDVLDPRESMNRA
ncbi:MAG: ABC transporter permease [Chloroflexi bacterium]|nr:ABC transporter permease [Chloroflexota bacterium]